jgi:hypothetical protein
MGSGGVRMGALSVVAKGGLAMLALASVGATVVGAQGIRVSGASTARYVGLRPLILDSVLASPASDSSGRFLRAGPTTALVALMQDVDATAWGFGRGMSAHAEVRFREAVGDGRALWPQAQQQLDVMAAYAELDRARFRARLGRQWHASELGYRNFDGAFVEAEPFARLVGVRVQGYVGSSLVQGLSRSLTSDALAAIEELPPDDRGMVFGASLRWRPRGGRTAARVQYEREIRRDRGALFAERAAFAIDAGIGQTALTGEAVYDLATSAFNELRLSASRLLVRGVGLVLEGRHSTPFFPLWTIWGAFSPVGFDEGRFDARWTSTDARLTIAAGGAYREYRETNTGVASLPLRTDGWRLATSIDARLDNAWSVQGSYAADVGSGAARTDGDLALRWLRSERLSAAARATAFETISEYRTGSGRVVGAGLDAAVVLRPDLRLAADLMVYRQRTNNRAAEGPWNQRRASLRLEWTLGDDPGMRLRERQR